MKIKSCLIIAVILACTTTAFAQSNFQESIATFRRDSDQALGNDFWFAPIMNDTGSMGNKSITLYISSPVNTTAYVECQGIVKSVSIPANGVGTFDIPIDREMNGSSVIYDDGIHVFSDTGDLSVYLMSTSVAGSNGMYCIPSIGWGTDYVVAGYESFFDSSHTNYDYPSEFTVTANQKTNLAITPTCDIRLSTGVPGYGYSDTSVGCAKGKIAQFSLEPGQCAQFQSVLARDQDNYDLTGTIVHANVPVGVVAGSMSPNIPPGWPGSNYICNMLPPIRTWGNTYYTTSSVQPSGLTGHDNNLYCFISSVPNQTIYRWNCNIGLITEAVLGPKYDHLYSEEEGANKFFSDEPFMLVQYINSPNYPDGIQGSGAPAEVVIDSKGNYSKDVFFQAVDSAGLGSADTNYANVVVNLKDTNNVTFDGTPINNYTYLCLDDTFGVYLVPNITPGAHEVKSDSGADVYVYGYGHSVAYEWAGSIGAWTYLPPDINPPGLSFNPENFCLHAAISGFGSELAEIILDSINNLSFAVDPNFAPQGSDDTSTFADFCVIDSMANGYSQFTVYDVTGNHSVGTIEFTAPHPGFTAQSILNFDTVLVGTSKTLNVFTVTDTSKLLPITIDSVWTDDSAFTINKTLPANSLPVTLTPGTSHTFSVTFSPTSAKIYSANAYALSKGLAPRSGPLIGGIGYTAGVANETQTKVSATLEPNPAANSVMLDFSLSQTSNVTFELSSMDGKTVFSWKANVESMGEHFESIDLLPLAAGNYVYRFEANGEATSGKLAVVR